MVTGAPGEIKSSPVVPSQADRLGEAGEAVLQGEVEVLREGADLARCGEVGARRAGGLKRAGASSLRPRSVRRKARLCRRFLAYDRPACRKMRRGTLRARRAQRAR